MWRIQRALCSHQLICYGLDNITDVHKSVNAQQLEKYFLAVPAEELMRSEEISLLIRHWVGKLPPQRIRVVGDLVLWDGPIWTFFYVSAHMSKTHFARSMWMVAAKYEDHISMAPELLPPEKQGGFNCKESNALTTNRDFLRWWKWDSIVAACEPGCGGCCCGNCQPGGKEMTLAEEWKLQVVWEGLTYITSKHHSKEQHWDTRYPWLEDPASLPNNKKAVEATFFRTEKKFSKEPRMESCSSAWYGCSRGCN